MCLPGLILIIFLVGASTPARADDAPPAGWFAFRWSGRSTRQSPCKKITDPQVAEIQKTMTCEKATTESGKPGVSCKKKDGSAGLFALESLAACKEERANQAANGP
jgi:hypothetical protein